MTWLIRGMFLAALAIAVGWGFMERKAANSLRSDLATVTETARNNVEEFEKLSAMYRHSEQEKRDLIASHNAEVSELFMASEQNRKAADTEARKLLDKAAVIANLNMSRDGVNRADQCEARLKNIDEYLSDYIEEVRGVSDR